MFKAGAGLRSFSKRGIVKWGIWLAFCFSAYFVYEVVAGIGVIGMIGGAIKLVVMIAILLCGVAALFSLFAAINGLITLKDADVNRAFIRNE